MSTSSISLSSISGSFPFSPKTIPLASDTKVTLGSTEITSSRETARVPSTSNGWFSPIQTEDTSLASVSPLPLSSSHAEVWCSNGKAYIRDLDSAFGTFVNGLRINKDITLKTGDTIRLGSPIARNDKTPVYITDLHLSPVIAKVTLTSKSS